MQHPRTDRDPEPTLEHLLEQGSWVRELAGRLVSDPADADDLAQETWARGLGRGAGSVESVRAWFGTIVRNLRREQLRSDSNRRARERGAARPEALTSAAEHTERLEEQGLLTRAVAGLDEPLRAVVVWHFYDGHSPAEIARRTGDSAQNVRRRLGRAVGELRQRLQHEHGAHWQQRLMLLTPLPPAASTLPLGAGAGAIVMGTKIAVGAACAVLLVVLAWNTWGSSGPSPAPGLGASAPALGGAALALDPESAARPGPGGLETPPDLDRGQLRALAAAALHGPLALSGQVSAEETGAPLPETLVGLFTIEVLPPRLFDHSGELEEFRSVHTDAEGRYRFEAVEPGRYELLFARSARLPERRYGIEVTGLEETTVDAALALGERLAVRVVDSTTALPVADAEVSLFSTDPFGTPTATRAPFMTPRAVTGPDGLTEVGGATRGPQVVLVRAAGYANARLEHTLHGGGGVREVELVPEAVILGTVRTSEGAVVSGARVFPNRPKYESPLSSFIYPENGVETDAGGGFELRGLPAGEHLLMAALPDGQVAFLSDRPGGRLRTLELAAGQTARVELVLPTPCAVAGLVVDDAGQPVEGVNVQVSWGDMKPRGAGFFGIGRYRAFKDGLHQARTTDAAGQFEIPVLRVSHRPLTLRVFRDGYAFGEVELDTAPGKLLEPKIALRELGLEIRGQLIDERGAPVPSMQVSVWERAVAKGAYFYGSTDEAGRYAIPVPTSRHGYEVVPRLRETSAWDSEPGSRTRIAAGSTGVDFVLTSRSTMEGRVLDDRGEPVREFELEYLWAEGVKGSRTARTERGDGRFRVALSPDRHRGVKITAPGFAPLELESTEGEHKLRLVEVPAREGVVLDESGAPIADAWITLSSLDTGPFSEHSRFLPRTRTDEAGHFRIEGLPADFRGSLALAPGRAELPELMRFPAAHLGVSPWELRIPATRTVRLELSRPDGRAATGGLRVLDTRGAPLDLAAEPILRQLAGAARPHHVLEPDGTLALQLAPGSYAAVVHLDGEPTAFAIDVPRGAGEFTLRETLQPASR